jgi:hypothetical protein
MCLDWNTSERPSVCSNYEAVCSHTEMRWSRVPDFTAYSPAWEAKSHWSGQGIPRHLLNPRVHCHVHTSPTPVPILGQLNPLHNVTPPYLFKIHIISASLPHRLFLWGSLIRIRYGLHQAPSRFPPRRRRRERERERERESILTNSCLNRFRTCLWIALEMWVSILKRRRK